MVLSALQQVEIWKLDNCPMKVTLNHNKALEWPCLVKTVYLFAITLISSNLWALTLLQSYWLPVRRKSLRERTSILTCSPAWVRCSSPPIDIMTYILQVAREKKESSRENFHLDLFSGLSPMFVSSKSTPPRSHIVALIQASGAKVSVDWYWLISIGKQSLYAITEHFRKKGLLCYLIVPCLSPLKLSIRLQVLSKLQLMLQLMYKEIFKTFVHIWVTFVSVCHCQI